MSSPAEKILKLFFECSPSERAIVLRGVRERTVESKLGVLTREDFERAIEDTPNLGAAAVKLGVCRRTLQYHMRLLGLPGGGNGKHNNLESTK